MIKKLRQLFCEHVFNYWGKEIRVINGSANTYHDLRCIKCGKWLTVKDLSDKSK